MMSTKTYQHCLLVILGMAILTPSCQRGNENEGSEQEERFFKLYMDAHHPGLEPDGNGLYYIEHEAGSGPQPGAEEWVRINYVGYSIPDERVVDTHLENVALDNGIGKDGALYGPLKMQVDAKSEGVSLGLQKMRAGGKASFFFMSDLGYGSGGNKMMRSIPAYTSLKYEVELLEIIPDIEAYEAQRILDYVDTIPGIDTIQDPASDALMYYVVDMSNDTGSVVAPDSMVYVNYKGHLIDGRVFDESKEGSPLKFQLGVTEMIEGWDLGMQRFKAGESGRLVIPYTLAYGKAGDFKGPYVSIPAYATLVFDVEVTEVKAASKDKDKD